MGKEWAGAFTGAGTPAGENRWSTESWSVWRNARADKIMDELNTIIPESRAIALQVEFVKLFTRDLPYLPLYYRLEWLAIRNGVTGVTPRIESGGQNMNTWNMHLWEKI